MEKESDRKCKRIETDNDLIKNPKNVRIAILGNVDSGKTSLVGVLSKGI
jgi:polynucleotide 5'-kinase involved in rRNA processing